VAQKGIRPVKLIQLNVWGGRLQNQIANFLKEERPDIVCLQEAISFNQEDAAVFLTIENIQKNSGLDYAVVAPVFSFNLMNGVAKFGNCILSRFPIQKSEIVFTHLEHKENFDFNEHNSNVRNFIHTDIKIKGRIYNFLTHHGYHIPDHKNGDEETLHQMKQLDEYLDQIKGPIVLTGDFNLAPHSKSLEQINKKLTNLSIKHHLKTTRTPLTHKTEVCDYIFVNDEVKIKDFYASDEIVSDHKALILEFDI
jgi:endonuclease/exonuclease/phosphatase family metal-dependent hydrolase